MTRQYLLAGVLLAWVASLGWSYYSGHQAGEEQCMAEQLRDLEVARIATDAAAASAAEAISKIEVRNVTIRQKLEREVREVPVYRDCRHSPDGLRAVNEALIGAGPEPTGGGQLPAADAAGQ